MANLYQLQEVTYNINYISIFIPGHFFGVRNTSSRKDTMKLNKNGTILAKVRFCVNVQHAEHREAKFKGRSGHFLTHFTKKFYRFLTLKVKNGTDIINPSTKSFDFLFWHEKIWSLIFKNFVENRQSTFHEFKFSVCLHTP